MMIRSDTARRRLALVTFAGFAVLTVLALVFSRGLANRPGLANAGASRLDLGSQLNCAALALGGLWLTWARPGNAIGWLLSLSGLLGALCNAGQLYGTRALVVPEEHLPLGTLALSLSAPLWIPGLLIPATLLLLRYPSGALSGRWDRWLSRAAVVGFVLIWLGYAGSPNSVTDEVRGYLPPVSPPAPVAAAIMLTGAAMLVVTLAAVAVSTARRMLRSGFPERPQIAWLLTTSFLGFVLVFLPIQWLGTVGFALISVAIAVGVLRYRLLGIEVVVRRTLLYGTLTGLVLLVFVVVTAGLAVVLPRGPTPQVVAASLVAVGLVPARDRVQRLVDRIVYGQRDDPWTALQRLSTPLGGSTEADVLPEIVASVAAAVRAPGAALLDPDGDPVVVSGEVGADGVRVPVRYGGEDLGWLLVAPRRGETGVPATDRRLLDTVAPLVAAVWYASRLADDLRDARARLLGATAAERTRLRQELHDGLGPALTGIGLGLEAVQRATGPVPADLVARLREETARSLDEVRRIIDDLRPGALSEGDLLAALRDRIVQINANSPVHVELHAPQRLHLPPDVETAAYRIADEALVNVLKHAHAQRCTVTVDLGDSLRLSIADDGVGRNGTPGRGLGMTSMRHRAQRLGGVFEVIDRVPGLEVVVQLPVVNP
jgi:two-component system, NarL family, sensor kinase